MVKPTEAPVPTKIFLRALHGLREQFKIIEVDSSSVKDNKDTLHAIIHDGEDKYNFIMSVTKRG